MNSSAVAFSDREDNLRELIEARSIALPHSSVRVLLPFDGSQAAQGAVRYVARNLEGTGVAVHLVNVQQPILGPGERLHATDRIFEALRQAGERVLASALDTLRAHGVETFSEVAFGRAADAIVRVAQENPVTLIVMGTGGGNPLVNPFSRSVPSTVVRRASLPVMLVRRSVDARLYMPRPPTAPFIAA